MLKKINLGAPSLKGKGAQGLAGSGFEDSAAYPMKVVITNHMPSDISLPEVNGLFLRNVCNSKGLNRATVEIESADQLKRLVSSIEQIAELSGYETAMTIEEVVAAKPLEVIRQKLSDETLPASIPAQPPIADNPENPQAGNSGKKGHKPNKRGQ